MLPGGRWRPERGVECFPSPPRRGRKAHVSRLAHALLARVGAQNLSCVVHAHVHICIAGASSLICGSFATQAHTAQRLVGPWPGGLW